MSDEVIAAHIERLRRNGHDDEHVEAKAAGRKLPKSVWESVSSFANTAGGLILCGLDEAHGFTVPPDFDAQRYLNELRAGLSRATGEHPKVEPVPDFDLRAVEVDGREIVALTINPLIGAAAFHHSPAPKPPCYVTDRGILNGSFKRVGDADVRLSNYEIYLLQTRYGLDRTDMEPVPGTSIQDLDEGQVQALLSRLRNTESRILSGIDAGDVGEILRRLNVVGAGGDLTLAGYLTLAPYPQQQFPQLVVDVTVHAGAYKSEDSQVRYLDRRRCDGALPFLVEDAVHTVMRNLRTRREVHGVRGVDIPEIPEDVLREGIVNAVMHRDYSDQVRGEPIAVDIYTDRVEIVSPGGFYGDRTKDNILIPMPAMARNQVIATLLRQIPSTLGGSVVAESLGSGIARMVKGLHDHGLPGPDFSATSIDHVVLVLKREQAGMREGAPGGASLQQPQQEVLEALDATRPRSVHDVAEGLGKSLGTVRIALRELVDAGLVIATAPPQSKNRRYLRASHA